MPRLLLLDNYDSFTYNLEHYLVDLGADVTVRRNDMCDVDPLEYDAIILSPGPGLPGDAGCMPELLRTVKGQVPVLGVCLGMQAMAEQLGSSLYNQEAVRHGVEEYIFPEKVPFFEGISNPTVVGLYHSWAVHPEGDFTVTAMSANHIVMAIENRELNWYGVQFHPESVMTPQGKQMLANFMRLLERKR